MPIKVTCFGSRGSLPSPSRRDFHTEEFGGNTSAYLVEAGPYTILLDAGSGILVLGNYLMSKGFVNKEFIHLLTHYHWDHIQGLPFCVPYYIETNTFYIHGNTPAGEQDTSEVRSVVERMLAEQQTVPHFPVEHGSLPAKKKYTGHSRQFSEKFAYQAYTEKEKVCVDPIPLSELESSSLLITTVPLNHPDGGLGYRIDFEGKSVAYCTDNEPLRYSNNWINKTCKNVDLLIMDGQYSEEQLKDMNQTFGHGSYLSVMEQAVDCGAKEVLIHHHDPNSSDKILSEREETAKRLLILPTYRAIEDVTFAREESTWEK